MRILVTAASKHGSTWEIAQAISDTLLACGLDVDVAHIEEVFDLSRYDGVVLGSAVYGGLWLKQAHDFIEDYAPQLSRLPVWLFSSGPIGYPLKPRVGQEVNLDPIAKLIRVKEHRVFAGRLRRQDLNLAERVIANVAHAQQGDFRNWEAIYAWATQIACTLELQHHNRVFTAHSAHR